MERVLLFDFDGTIADSLEVYFETFTEICSELGFERINSREAFLNLLDGNAFWKLLLAGFPMWRLKRLARDFEPRIEAAHQRLFPFPGMIELLNDLAAAGPVYVVTSNDTAVTQGFLERHGVLGIRDVVGADIEKSKVKKTRRIMRRHAGAEGYYIGDTRGDILEAARAGVMSVAVTWGWHAESRLAEAEPDHVVHTPVELRALFEPQPAAAHE